ncbi:MAG: hypothetical protein LBV61_08785 [Burkholderiaceae bacterium]|jgi:hypothetical protein|nr:hypothetical protein [Burkholderiaceae bacterium]
MTLWFLFSVMSVLTSIWVHFRHPGERRQAWYSFVAGQSVFMLLLAGCGTAIFRAIEGRWPSTLGDLVFVTAAVAGLVISLRGLRRTSSLAGHDLDFGQAGRQESSKADRPAR